MVHAARGKGGGEAARKRGSEAARLRGAGRERLGIALCTSESQGACLHQTVCYCNAQIDYRSFLSVYHIQKKKLDVFYFLFCC